MKKYSLKTVIVLMLLASALICILMGFFLWRWTGLGTKNFHEVLRYAELLRKIDRYYVGDYDPELVADAAMDAAVSNLGDRWSYYLNREAYAQYINSSNNEYVGLGIVIEQEPESGALRILRVYADSPAMQAGLQIGDLITAVDGESILELDLTQAKAKIARPAGQAIALTVDRNGETLAVDAVCDHVFVSPVEGELLTDGVGLITIMNFDKGSSEGFQTQYEALLEQGAEAFVFDVRSNPGGYVSELCNILDYLLGSCEIFVSVAPDGEETVTTSDEAMQDDPAVVLVNGDSYSAAEYFAAVLSDYGYARTVGTHTTGKGRSQITVELMDGGALHISSAEYVTPNRVSLYDQGGIAPDYTVELSEEKQSLLLSGALAPEQDEQLQKALALLK